LVVFFFFFFLTAGRAGGPRPKSQVGPCQLAQGSRATHGALCVHQASGPAGPGAVPAPAPACSTLCCRSCRRRLCLAADVWAWARGPGPAVSGVLLRYTAATSYIPRTQLQATRCSPPPVLWPCCVITHMVCCWLLVVYAWPCVPYVLPDCLLCGPAYRMFYLRPPRGGSRGGLVSTVYDFGHRFYVCADAQ
jgi:hypothetical protein